MNYHVFVVDQQTLKVHLDYMFAGTGAKNNTVPFLRHANTTSIHHGTERNLAGMIADISRVRIGDKVIFYLQAKGNTQGTFFGVFKAVSEPFFDENDENNYLKSALGKGLPFRVRIACDEVFPWGITEHDYLDSLDSKNKPCQLCWSLIYRKLKGNRGCTMITDFEFNDLLRKLRNKNNHKLLPFANVTYNCDHNCLVSGEPHQYSGRTGNMNIFPRLQFKQTNRQAFETHLQAYIMQNFDKPPLSNLLLSTPNANHWIGNEVSCGVGMQRMDIVLKEKTDDSISIKVIELKDEPPENYIVDSQLPWYVNWLSEYIVPNYIASGKSLSIQPCIIAAQTLDDTILGKIRQTQLHSLNCTVLPTEFIDFRFTDDQIIFRRAI